MYLNILDTERQTLLRSLPETLNLSDFYMAGGTALSLQLGLRESMDFDFFTPLAFNEVGLLARLREAYGEVAAIRVASDTCDAAVRGVQVSFLRYPYPLVGPLVRDEAALPGLALAGLDDIAAMKWSAIGGRGSKKDFYDLYQIYRRVPGFDAQRLWRSAHGKFGRDVNYAYMIMGLSYFEDAEGEVLPRTFQEADWDDIKRFFRREQNKLMALEHDVRNEQIGNALRLSRED